MNFPIRMHNFFRNSLLSSCTAFMFAELISSNCRSTFSDTNRNLNNPFNDWISWCTFACFHPLWLRYLLVCLLVISLIPILRFHFIYFRLMTSFSFENNNVQSRIIGIYRKKCYQLRFKYMYSSIILQTIQLKWV